MAVNKWDHSPNEKWDYHIDWSADLANDEIASSDWTVDDDTITIEASPPPTAHTATIATVWVSGGTVGMTYTLTNHIVTEEGREGDGMIYLYVVDG